MNMGEIIRCAQCSMLLASDSEYHPYGACLMFRACGDGDQVRRCLAAIRGVTTCKRVIRELHEAQMEQKPGSLLARRFADMESGALRCEAALNKDYTRNTKLEADLD